MRNGHLSSFGPTRKGAVLLTALTLGFLALTGPPSARAQPAQTSCRGDVPSGDRCPARKGCPEFAICTCVYGVDDQVTIYEVDRDGDGGLDGRYLHTYDDLGRMTASEWDSICNGVSDSRTVYSYDESGNLISEELDLSADGTVDERWTHTYDEAGQRTASTFARTVHNPEAVVNTFFEFFYDSNRNRIRATRDDLGDGSVDLDCAYRPPCLFEVHRANRCTPPCAADLNDDERSVVDRNLLTEEPNPDFPINAVFGDAIELIGYDIEPTPLQAGEPLTIIWYWRALAEIEGRWQFMVELRREDHRQTSSHEAISGLFYTIEWEVGQIVRDRQTVTLDTAFAESEVQIDVRLARWHHGDELTLTSLGGGQLTPDLGYGPRLIVGSFMSVRPVVTLEAGRLDGELTIDGRLTDRAWRRADRTDYWVHPNTGETAGSTASARVLWDDEALYIGMSARDRDIWATITERDGNLWEEEILEVMLDPGSDGTDYLDIEVNPLGTVFDAVFPQATGRDLSAARAIQIEGLQWAVDVNGTPADREQPDTRWSVEIRIPWNSLPDFDAPIAGTEIRANFYRFDRPADARVSTSAWSPVFGGSFHQPDKFGIIVLSE